MLHTVTPSATATGSSSPIRAATSGLAGSAPSSLSTTSGAGGLDTSRINSVASCSAKAPMAAPAISPPTSADRSRPPTPITCDTPDPHRCSRVIASWAPVPAAATTPTGPAATRLENPRPTPASAAVPAPGPITSLPAERARAFRAISSSSGTLSLNNSTSRPRVRAFWVSRAAYSPGTETMATLAFGAAARASSRSWGRGAPSVSTQLWAAGSNRTHRPASRAAAAAGSPSARRASTKSLTPAPSSPSAPEKPSAARVSRLAGVAIAAQAQSTPSASSMARVASSSRTLSA